MKGEITQELEESKQLMVSSPFHQHVASFQTPTNPTTFSSSSSSFSSSSFVNIFIPMAILPPSPSSATTTAPSAVQRVKYSSLLSQDNLSPSHNPQANNED
jgi:hypothetical protein